jgi:FdhD protein
VISESALNVLVDGTTYTLLRTPGKDRELAVGFLLTEGLIETLNDIMLLSECPDSPNVITIRTRAPKEKPQRTLIMTSSCGLCGRDDIDGLLESLGRIESDLRIPLERIYRVPAAVRQLQTLFGSTGSAHASALIQPDGRVQCVKEDVGRHNALDKLIGYALMCRLSMADTAVFLSGRVSIELVIKAAKARIPILLAVGAPTSAAVDTAQKLGMTLCGFLRDEGVSVYSHQRRIIAGKDG